MRAPLRLVAAVAVLLVAIGVTATPAHAVTGSAAHPAFFDDSAGDVPAPQGDLTTSAISYYGDTLTVFWQLAAASDFRHDQGWLSGKTYLVTHFDTNGDGVADYDAVFANDGDGNMLSVVVRNADDAVLCNGVVRTYVGASTDIYVTLPAGCISHNAPLGLSAEMVWQPAGAPTPQVDAAPDTGTYGPVDHLADATVTAGGLVVDGWGGVHRVTTDQSLPQPVTTASYWPGWNIVRGIASTFGSLGYVVDAWGGLHGFAPENVSLPVDTTGGPYWPGWDIARGVALMPDGTGGYVLDAWGGLHPFAVGDSAPPPMPVNSAYWKGWDIARGVALLPDGSGGYVLDGWGGLHPFALPGHNRPPAPTGGPYWPGWDVARGVSMAWDRPAGLVADGWGGLHQFNIGSATPINVGDHAYWPGWDIARGLSLLPGT